MRIGIDLGGTNIVAAAVDKDYHIIAKKSIPTKRQRHFSEIIKDMGNLSIEVMKMAKLGTDDIESVGIGSPGIIDKKTGCVIYSNNIKWHNVDIRGGISTYINKQAYIDNDANCAALGEFIAGAACGYNSAVMVTFGTGVGGGIILDKKIYNGFNSAANVIGHMTIMSGGEQCTCGRHGCWEAYASVSALINMAVKIADTQPQSYLSFVRERDGELNGANIFEADKMGDSHTKTLIKKYFKYIADGITNIINILQPEVIILGGGLSNLENYLLEPIKEQVINDVYCKTVALPAIKTAKLKNDAGIIGAAYLGANN